jgi:MFS family permease
MTSVLASAAPREPLEWLVAQRRATLYAAADAARLGRAARGTRALRPARRVRVTAPAGQRAVIALVQLLALSVWFAAAAVLPALREEWTLGSAALVWLTASVQLGFAAGAVCSAVLNLPDRLPAHRMMAACAFGASVCTAAPALLPGGFSGTVAMRFATGVFLAGVYPVGVKLTASWTAPARRARAFGVLIGALTLGSALPHLVRGLVDLPWRSTMLVAAGLGALGGLTALAVVRPGGVDSGAERAPFRPRYALTMFTQRRPRLVNIGYLGHMWELYALWTWLPSFLTAADLEHGRTRSGAAVGIAVFVAVGAAGAAGCLFGGWLADRRGPATAARTALVVSGLCAAASPLVFDAAPFWTWLCCLIWGAAVIADSGAFSTALSQVADRRYTGTALTTQTALGFAITVITMQCVPLLAAAVGWQYAFLLLVPGPVVGALAMRSLAADVRGARRRCPARPAVVEGAL